jgi:hypothetical protein
MLSIKDLISGNTVAFVRYQKGELWYEVDTKNIEDSFEFPVPISDTGDGAFNAVDSAIYYMRWIKKQHDLIVAEKAKVYIS